MNSSLFEICGACKMYSTLLYSQSCAISTKLLLSSFPTHKSHPVSSGDQRSHLAAETLVQSQANKAIGQMFFFCEDLRLSFSVSLHHCSVFIRSSTIHRRCFVWTHIQSSHKTWKVQTSVSCLVCPLTCRYIHIYIYIFTNYLCR